MSKKLSPHFADYELQCKCKRHRGNPLCNVSPRLLMLAERVRDVLKTPMIVTSCCRCPAHNADPDVKGSPTSKHITTDKQPSRAMDFKAKGMTPSLAFDTIIREWACGGLGELGGIGLYDTWLHIDTAKAEDGHLRVWDERKKKTTADSEILGQLVEDLRGLTTQRPAAVINRLCIALNEWR